MKLIDDWKSFHKFWSVRLGIAAAVLYSFVETFPNAAIAAWADLPDPIKAMLPPNYLKGITVGLAIAAFLSRIVKQTKLSSTITALLICMFIPLIARASASGGLMWAPVTTYDDGTPLANGEKVEYVLFTADGKQVGWSFDPSLPASKIPADGCYYVIAAFYSAASNSVIPASYSDPSETVCIAPKPVQRRPAKPTGVTAVVN